MDNKVEQEFNSLVDQRRNSKVEANGTKHINIGYLLALFLTVALGTIQFGYSIGSWNAAFDAYQ
jgi:hypothetical protein